MPIEQKDKVIFIKNNDQCIDDSTGKNSPKRSSKRELNKNLSIKLSGIVSLLTSFKSILQTFSKVNSYSDQSFFILLTRIFNVIKKEGLNGIFSRILLRFYLNGFTTKLSYKWQKLYSYPSVTKKNASNVFKISVIVPNYNHARYLQQRLESIFNQNHPIHEVILLDDCSTDESRDILTSYQKRYPSIVKCHFNSVNSGGVFYQWAKGIELATGDLIWIAESDDYCSSNFLSELSVPFTDSAVKIAFCRTLFVSGDTNKIIFRSEDYLKDLNINLRHEKFVVSANAIVKTGWVVKNIIPNVSSAIFRHPGKMPLFKDPVWLSMRLCGDWVFYLVLIRAGLVAYNSCATNYYRQHALNTSVMAQREKIYYKEHYMVREYLESLYNLTQNDFDRQYNHLYRHWCIHNGLTKKNDFDLIYAPSKHENFIEKPQCLNIAIATYALAGGGGETFPLMLANLLHRKGHSVVVIDFNQLPAESGVRDMLDPTIPLLRINRLSLIPAILMDMNIDVIHSHHAFVDMTIATLIENNTHIKHIITMHGMYEMFSKDFFSSIKDKLELIDKFVYTADKNLTPFSKEFMIKKSFQRINNAVTALPFQPILRKDLDINEQDFVLCMVARAIPEKGWEEAIEAVCLANQNSGRVIHLLLIGEGTESMRLKPIFANRKFIHFLGFRSDIRAFFACSDMGFIPSRFKGESFPLVLIDCLATNRPVLASDIGEISKMLATSTGNAGVVFSLDNWNIPVEMLANLIKELANNSVLYKQVCQNVHEAVEKFDLEKMVTAYEKIYYDLCC